MKRCAALFLALVLILSGCANSTPAPSPSAEPSVQPSAEPSARPDPNTLSAEELLQFILTRVPEGEEGPELVDESELTVYCAMYGLPQEYLNDMAVARLGGARVFEIAVIDMARSDTNATDGLLDYLSRRWADFGGYAPDEADIAKEGKLYTVNSRRRLILALSEDNSAVVGALLGAGYDRFTTEISAEVTHGSSEIPPSEEPQSSEQPSSQPPVTSADPAAGRLPYVDPNIDDMTVYDTSAILDAWESGDSSALSDYDRAILEAASGVLADILTPGMTPLERETAVYLWMTRNVSYDYDHYDPLAKLSPASSTPYNPLMEGKGICLGFSVTFQLFMDMAGIECITVIGAANRSMEDHAWNMVRLNGNWYCVDSTWDSGVSQRSWRYFNVTSDFISKHDHQWDYASVPEATAKGYGK